MSPRTKHVEALNRWPRSRQGVSLSGRGGTSSGRHAHQGGNRSRTRSLTTSPPTRDPSCGACHMDRLGGIGIRVSWLLNPPFRLRTFTPASGTPAQYTLCSVRVLSWLCWTLTVSFTRQPCPADMEPTDGLDPSGAMIEMICLFIAALGCMTTILPCCRAFVLQCSSPPTMASSRFPLACLLLLTAVFAPLASALTFPKLPALLVPPAMPLPLASCCSTPHVPRSERTKHRHLGATLRFLIRRV